jgi:uncharacterized membrane protein
MKVSRRFSDWAGLIAVVAIALIARFHSITVPAVWYDEAYSLLLAEGAPSYIWSTTALDVHPPLYYVLLHYWMLVWGNGVLSARSLSALADVGTLLLCIKLMSLVATRRATWIAALLLALLPISVRYSQEIRMYTLLGFWLMGATVALVCWVNSPQRKCFAVLYVLLMTAAFYTHYFAALCVLVHWLFWWKSRGLSARVWGAANGVIVLLYLPWAPHLIDHVLHRHGLEWIPPLTWHTALTGVWQFTVLSQWVPVTSWWRAALTFLILICAGAVLLSKRTKQHYSILLVAYFLVPVIAIFLVSLVVPVFDPRYLVFAAVGLPMMVAVALDARGTREIVIALAVTVVLLAQGVSTVYQQTDKFSGSDVRRMAELDILAADLAREAKPDDEIVVDGLFDYLPFRYYNTTDIQPRIYVYKSSNVGPMSPSGFGGWTLVPTRVDGSYFTDFSVMETHARRVWWVTGKSRPEQNRLFPKNWIQVLSLRAGEGEARLFVLDGAPTSHEIAMQPLFTQQPPH